MKEGVNDPNQKRYVDGILRSTESIRDECVFAKSYIDIGIKTPSWQKLDVVLINASASLSLRGAQLRRRVDNLDIFADPLLETVFHNLFDNSLGHGERVKNISVTAAPWDSGWQIVVEDDGIGIPDELKERIFEEGFGKNTGLGLHLCRRILAITDITLMEEGRWGEGARFVMRVPMDRIRNG